MFDPIIGVGVAGRRANSDFDRLHGFEDRSVIFASVVQRPNVLADHEVQRILRKPMSTYRALRVWLSGKLPRAPTRLKHPTYIRVIGN